MSNATTTVTNDESSEAIHVYIPRRFYLLPAIAVNTGLILGLLRGSRKESLRFLAENAHRPPTTVQGWYFYNKTKNYRVLLAGLQEGGKESLRLGSVAVGWVGFEELFRMAGLSELKEVGAGCGTAAVVSGIYRLPRAMTIRTMALGLFAGGLAGVLRKMQDYVAIEKAKNDATAVE